MTHSVRFSIAGVMGVVLIVSVGLAALRSGSHIWAGAVFLLTCGALALAAVGSIVDTRGARAWWLGFTACGCGYLALAFYPTPVFYSDAPGLPTDPLLRFAFPYLGPGPYFRPGPRGLADNPYLQTGHCLFGLLAGTLGGSLACLLFGASRIDPPPSRTGTRRRRAWPAVVGLASSVLLATITMIGARKSPGLWAGATVLLTWGLLGLATVAAVCGRGRRRAGWLGASLFGAGYMLLVAGLPLALVTDASLQPWPQVATNRLLNGVRRSLPAVVREYPPGSDAVALANARILRALDRPIPMRFPQETPLRDVLAYVVTATRSPDGYEVPIYVDPAALKNVEKTLESPVTIALEGAPLRTSLGLALEQLSLLYSVKGGVLIVDDNYDPLRVARDDPFLTIGQSLLALLAAGVGGAMAAVIHDPRGETAAEARP